ncbi:predicted protein [Arabidopsis lyrata subsp. lyrata]|uniref:Predicted protein n=1 Tax=Arabidopsis lyrata subsp. lyrata TaxID=81972 RepID=D7LBR6_ARALL|nr:predicted protein [Arabidopsis lyrata subsp. lyrata]
MGEKEVVKEVIECGGGTSKLPSISRCVLKLMMDTTPTKVTSSQIMSNPPS